MRKLRTAVALLAMTVAIGGAIAAGPKTAAPVFIDNGTGNPPTLADPDLYNQPGEPGAWTCTLPASTPCFYEAYDEIGQVYSQPSENGNYQPL